ncbi:MAG: class I SAM-dependent methyltransferase, partial [Candidatus Poribacteria bacterium]|nr:class I SAM-dependent methyltransferase [Candidatus Poribacteria bacterium]
MPTSPKVKHQLLHVLSQNEIQGTICELGSGWGTLAFALARRFPKCRIIAYENSLVPYIYSQIYKLVIKTENLHIKQENFF